MSIATPRLVESYALRQLLWAPTMRTPGERPPLLCFLHGYDEAAPMPIQRALTLHGPLAPLAAPIARARFAILAPQLPRAGDRWYQHQHDLETALAAAIDATGADASRVYLTGFSFGGNGVLDLGIAMRGRFAALWAVDPTRVPASDPGAPVWLSIGDAARPRAAGFVRALGTSPAPPSPETPTASRVHLDEGLDHVGSAASAYADARIYDWLLSVPRSSPARGE